MISALGTCKRLKKIAVRRGIGSLQPWPPISCVRLGARPYQVSGLAVLLGDRSGDRLCVLRNWMDAGQEVQRTGGGLYGDCARDWLHQAESGCCQQRKR